MTSTNKYTISVIIPVYNNENHVNECMDSLLLQDDKNFEILVIDDGSTDNSLEIINSYADRFENLTVIKQSNTGSGGARNMGMKHACGEFLLFIDSDDYVAPNYISILREKQAYGNFDMVCGQYHIISENGKMIKDLMKPPPICDPPLSLHEEILGAYDRCMPWARLFRKSDALKSGVVFPSLVAHEDWFFTYKLIRKLKTIGFVDDKIYYWRQREGSTSKSMSADHIDILPFLRSDTNLYLNRFDGSEREFNLAARRNLAVTISYRNKIKRSGDVNLAYFAKNICADKDRIINDLIRHKSSEFFEKQLSKSIKQIIEEAESITESFDELKSPTFYSRSSGQEKKKLQRKKTQEKADKAHDQSLKLSLVTPSFNQRPFLEKMIESIDIQKVKPFEHIILDAGSHDGSIELIKKYKKNNTYVKFFVGRDNGQVNAINIGLSESHGDIIGWLNTDDYYSNETVIKNVLQVFESDPDVDVVYGRGNFVDATGKFIQKTFISKEASQLAYSFLTSVGILQPALFMRKTVFEKVGPLNEDLNLCFDYDYWIRVAISGAKFHFFDELLCEATLHKDSKTIGQRHKQLLETVETVKQHYGFAPVEWLEKLTDCELNEANGITQKSKKKTTEHEQIINQYFIKLNNNRRSIASVWSIAQSKYASHSLEKMKHLNIDYDLVIAIALNNSIFNEGIKLLSSVQSLKSDQIAIVVYDLGLSVAQITILNQITDVYLLSFPLNDQKYFQGYFSQETKAYKYYIAWHTGLFLKQDTFLIYFDPASVEIIDLKPLISILKKEQALLISYGGCRSGLSNLSYMCNHLVSNLKPSVEELLSQHLFAGIFGYKIGGLYHKLFVDAYELSKTNNVYYLDNCPGEVVTGVDHEKTHNRKQLLNNPSAAEGYNIEYLRELFGFIGCKHDQVMLSVLAARYKAPYHLLKCFIYKEKDKPDSLNIGYGKNLSDSKTSRLISNLENTIESLEKDNEARLITTKEHKAAIARLKADNTKKAQLIINRDDAIEKLKADNTKKAQLIINRDDAIEKLKADNTKKAQLIINREDAIEKLKADNTKKAQLIVNRDDAIEKLKAERDKTNQIIMNRDGAILKLKAENEKKDILISNRDNAIKKQKEEIERKNLLINNRNNSITKLKSAIEGANVLANKRKLLIDTFSTEQLELSRELSDRNRLILQHENLIAQLKQKNADLEHKKKALNEQLEYYRSIFRNRIKLLKLVFNKKDIQ